MAKTKGYVVTTSEGEYADCGAVFTTSLEHALAVADEFAADGHAGYIMKVKGVYAYEPCTHEVEEVVVTEVTEATGVDTMDDWSDLL